jgi:hypothetical protein
METVVKRGVLVLALLPICMGARQQSANFIVETADPQLAAQIDAAAEGFRHDLAIEWLGHTMPNWAQPCMMTVKVAPNLGAGGATTFVFDHGEVFGWRMNIQGSAQRVLDSVLPHEVTHMIFASHFRRPLPRWADEGGATSVEHESEKSKHRTMLVQFLRTGRGIAFNQMFAMTEYPQDVMPLYAQGYALSEYLIERGGHRGYVAFLEEGMRTGQWSETVQHHYGLNDLSALQTTWVDWVAHGFPNVRPPAATVAAATVPAQAAAAQSIRRERPEPNLVFHLHDKASAEQPVTTIASEPADNQGVVQPASATMAAPAPQGVWESNRP